METKEPMENKQCDECKKMLPLHEFASHVDAKSGFRYYRRQCRDCVKARWRAAHGKPRGILRHLSPEEVEKIRANADLFERGPNGRPKVSIRKSYMICKPSVSLSIWYRAAANGDFLAIIQEKNK